MAVDLAAFAHEPTDARSACVAAIKGAGDVPAQVASCRELGAPIVLVLAPKVMQLWRQGKERPELATEVPGAQTEGFFRKHRADLAPQAVYRAKTWGRLDRHYQLDFVDFGFMPVIEAEMGKRLTSLIERLVQGLRKKLWARSSPVPANVGQWLLKSAFWLVAGKILQDKRVEGFIAADLGNVEDLFRRIAKHYDSRAGGHAGVEIRTRKQRDALAEAAEKVARFSHLGHVTTESLAHVYESALITRETRASLGTHSTPQYLVDYIVGKLAGWIEQIPVDERNVFEPACGHAAFLVASMRLLKDLLPPGRRPDSKQYLRKRLHGIEVDPFALEIARLSLTLADIPNPNGWDLSIEDVFETSDTEKRAREATIVLANPPFERFTRTDRNRYARDGLSVSHQDKTTELLARVLPALRPGAVLGFVVPQGLLHSRDAQGIRRMLAEDFEIGEICLLPDKVFEFSDAECAVITARRATGPLWDHRISYRRVREPDFKRFRLDYEVTTRQSLSQETIGPRDKWSLRLPDLPDLWLAVSRLPVLDAFAAVGKGFDFRGSDLPAGTATILDSREVGQPGFVKFDAEYTHVLPTEYRVNTAREAVKTPRAGTVVGSPQVLLNYGRVSRGPWRLKALIDRSGHAVTSRFITVRPRSPDTPLRYLWALLNSPVANAFVHAHSMKRDVLIGMMRKMPVPDATPSERQGVVGLVTTYLDEVTGSSAPLERGPGEDPLRRLLMEIDAEILRLYDLSPRLERELLDIFAGHQRRGVPFRFDRYFPEDFEPWVHLHEYLSEDYARSTAGALRQKKGKISAELMAVLRKAAEQLED